MLKWLFGRKEAPQPAAGSILDETLLDLAGSPWTVRHAVEGVFISGATGSGKTTASGNLLADAFLTAGFGALVLTVKPDEADRWRKLCDRTGRTDDLRIVTSGGPHRFNFIDHEAHRDGAGAGLVESIVAALSNTLELPDHGRGGGREEEGYWRRAARQLMRNSVHLLLLAGESVSVPAIMRVVNTAPTSSALMADDVWKARSVCLRLLRLAEQRCSAGTDTAAVRQRTDLEVVADWWLGAFPDLSEKTRSVIVSTFSSAADVLNRGVLRELLCEDTTLTPEETAEGRIIVLDLPVLEYGETGVLLQGIWKYAFQRAMSRRDMRTSPRPVILWMDEAQHFITSHDQMFQTTCRSARVATVMLTQNTGNLYAVLGGDREGRPAADSLLGNLNTKIIHANTDPVTNEWAAGLLGRCRRFFLNAGTSRPAPTGWWSSARDDHSQHSGGVSEQMDYEMQPAEFAMLRTGGPAHGGIVDAVVHCPRLFGDRAWKRVTFRQG